MNIYQKGSVVRLTATFTDPLNDEAAIDPTAVYLTVVKPSEEELSLVYGTDADLIKSSTGVYRYDCDLDESGTWYYRWHSTGTGQAAQEGQLEVEALFT